MATKIYECTIPFTYVHYWVLILVVSQLPGVLDFISFFISYFLFYILTNDSGITTTNCDKKKQLKLR